MTWSLYTRESSGAILAQIEDYQSLTVTSRFNAVGTFTLDMDYSLPTARALAQSGTGIYLIKDDTYVVFSGWITSMDRKRDGTTNRATFAGKDDMMWLAARVAHPQPGSATPPYSTSAYDVRTGTCTTVLREYVDANAGPGAVPGRRVTWGGLGGLTLGTDPAAGASVTGRARWQNLLELLQELALAGGGIGFRIQHTGAALEFQAYQPADKSTSIRFSHDLGNMASYGFTVELPSTDYVYLGGQGEGTARTIIEIQDPAAVVTHGRFEVFQDRRDTADAAELVQAGQENLEENKAKAGLSFTPVDTASQEYRTDYDLGDKVTAYLDEEPVSELIREVTITIDEDGVQVKPTIGTPGAGSLLKVFTALTEQNRRLSHIERR